MQPLRGIVLSDEKEQSTADTKSSIHESRKLMCVKEARHKKRGNGMREFTLRDFADSTRQSNSTLTGQGSAYPGYTGLDQR